MKALGATLLFSVVCLFHFALWYFVLTHTFFTGNTAALAAAGATVAVAVVVGVTMFSKESP